jgi:hypothetical protein
MECRTILPFSPSSFGTIAGNCTGGGAFRRKLPAAKTVAIEIVADRN